MREPLQAFGVVVEFVTCLRVHDEDDFRFFGGANDGVYDRLPAAGGVQVLEAVDVYKCVRFAAIRIYTVDHHHGIEKAVATGDDDSALYVSLLKISFGTCVGSH